MLLEAGVVSCIGFLTSEHHHTLSNFCAFESGENRVYLAILQFLLILELADGLEHCGAIE